MSFDTAIWRSSSSGVWICWWDQNNERPTNERILRLYVQVNTLIPTHDCTLNDGWNDRYEYEVSYDPPWWTPAQHTIPVRYTVATCLTTSWSSDQHQKQQTHPAVAIIIIPFSSTCSYNETINAKEWQCYPRGEEDLIVGRMNYNYTPMTDEGNDDNHNNNKG